MRDLKALERVKSWKLHIYLDVKFKDKKKNQ